jgi:hypothetical protein
VVVVTGHTSRESVSSEIEECETCSTYPGTSNVLFFNSISTAHSSIHYTLWCSMR